MVSPLTKGAQGDFFHLSVTDGSAFHLSTAYFTLKEGCQALAGAKLFIFQKISLKAHVGFAIVAAQFLYEEALIWL